MLGAGPCYHMVSVLGDLEQVSRWQRALAGEHPWPELFSGYDSTVDWPGGYFWRELLDVYPDAKVLLSIRDPERWAESMGKTICAVWRGDGLMRQLSQARRLIDPGWQGYVDVMTEIMFGPHGTLLGTDDDPAALAELMGRHTAEVRATVPAGRLVVWEPADGWEPLCELLGVAIPDQPLPHVNDSTAFEDRVIEGSLAALNHYWDKRQGALA